MSRCLAFLLLGARFQIPMRGNEQMPPHKMDRTRLGDRFQIPMRGNEFPMADAVSSSTKARRVSNPHEG